MPSSRRIAEEHGGAADYGADRRSIPPVMMTRAAPRVMTPLAALFVRDIDEISLDAFLRACSWFAARALSTYVPIKPA